MARAARIRRVVLRVIRLRPRRRERTVLALLDPSFELQRRAAQDPGPIHGGGTVRLIDHRPGGPHHGRMVGTDLGRLLLESHRALATELVALLAERGYPDIRAGHAAVFLHIDRRSGTRLTELARRARMTKQGMMLVVDDLEGRGYVRRVPDPEDGRAKVVRLTAHGRRCAAESRRAAQVLESQTRRLLGDRRYETLREALEEVAATRGAFDEE